MFILQGCFLSDIYIFMTRAKTPGGGTLKSIIGIMSSVNIIEIQISCRKNGRKKKTLRKIPLLILTSYKIHP